MKKLSLLLSLALAFNLSAQEAEDKGPWSTGGNFGLQFTQASYSNWQAGGVNSVAGNSLVNLFANYNPNEKWSWNNNLTLAYGLNFQDTIFNKTEDRIELESRVDYKKSKRWNYSALLNFRSQFAPGFANPGESGDDLRISDFLAPAYLINSVGAAYKDESLTAYLSPLTSKTTFVMVDRLAEAGAFGVKDSNNIRFEVGVYVNLTFKKKLWDNIDLQARVDLFSNYAEDPTLVDVNSELLLFFQVTEYIKANITLAYIYDHDVKFDTDNNPLTVAVPRGQFKQVLSIGFSYAFGAKK